MVKKFFNDLGNLATNALNHTRKHKNEIIPKMIANGWYPSTITFRCKLKEDESIDDFMERCLTGEYYDQIKNDYIIGKNPNRNEILTEAFNLYEEQRYIACIPLFLSQIDGIVSDTGKNGFFIGKKSINSNENKNQLIYMEYLKTFTTNLPKNSEDAFKGLYLMLYSGVLEDTDTRTISNGSTKVDAKVIGGLNRHGILHGKKEFINYGSKINALKVISLLLFVIQTLDVVDMKIK